MKLRLLTAMAVGAALFAQTRPGPRFGARPGADELKTFLALTDSQVDQLQQLRRSEGEALRPIFQQISEKQRSLQERLRSGSSDAAALGQILLDVENLRKQADTTRGGFRDRALALLTAEQKAKLKTLEDAEKLQPVIRQAAALQLLTPALPVGPGDAAPLGGPGFRFGPRSRMGRN